MRYSKGTATHDQELHLNIASIIDCFTVLITYMLISASFISLGVLDVNDLTQRGVGDTTPEAKVSLLMKISPAHQVTLQLSDSAQSRVTIPAKDGAIDREAMQTQLAAFKQKSPDLSTRVVSAGSDVEYVEIVKVIDSSKSLLPNITLGERAD